MPRSAIPVTTISRSGVANPASTASDATNKHAIATNDGRVFLHITSTDAGAQYVDVEIATTVDGDSVVSKRIAVAAGATVIAGPWPTPTYNQLAVAADATLNSDATAPQNNDTVTIDATTYTFKTTLTEAYASGTLTSDATAPAAADTVTVGSKTYTFRTALTEVYATGTLTSDATAPANGDTVTIGSTTYTFRTALGSGGTIPYEVLIGGSAANALSNLKKAINLSGVAGTDYGSGGFANADVSGGTLTATTLALTAKTLGTGGNSVATTETSAHLSFGGATLSGGVNAVAYEVLIGGSAANALSNLKKAMNLSGVAGTDYSTATVAHATVTPGTLTSTTLNVLAAAGGTAGNSIATTKSSGHLAWSTATLTGGFDADAILIDPSVSATLALRAFKLPYS